MFCYDAAYSDGKDLTMRTISDEILKDIAYDISRSPKYDEYQIGLGIMVYTFFWQENRIRSECK